MKYIILLLITATTVLQVKAQFRPVDQGSTIHFKIKNFGINTGGDFTGLQGTINFDIDHLNESSFDVSIDAGSVNTGVEMRDDHLRGDTYFDVKNYPRIRFVSTKVTTTSNAGVLYIFGKLTIKSQTKDVSFPFTATKTKDNGYVFKGTFTINRRDFGVGGSSVISDNLDMDLSVFTEKLSSASKEGMSLLKNTNNKNVLQDDKQKNLGHR